MSTQPLTQIPPNLTLSGTNVVLRSPSLSDAAALREIFSDLTTMQHLRFMTHESQGGWTLAEMSARLERQIAKQQDNEALVTHIYAIDQTTGTETLAGVTGFTEIDMENLNAHCGIILHHSHWSRGLATEAFYLVLRYGFETLGLHRVIFETTEKNEGMRGWLEKVVGVQVEGIRREELRVHGKWVDSWGYAIFEENWRDKVRAELERRIAKKNGEELESVLERMNIRETVACDMRCEKPRRRNTNPYLAHCALRNPFHQAIIAFKTYELYFIKSDRMQQEELLDQIKTEFESFGQLTPEVISDCLSICLRYSLRPRDLKFKWEAYAFKLPDEGHDNNQPTQAHLRQLRNEIQREFERQSQSQRKQKATAPIADRGYNDESFSEILQDLGIPAGTPEQPEDSKKDLDLSKLPIFPSPNWHEDLGSSLVVSSVQSGKFTERTNQAKIEETLNLQLSLAPPRADMNRRCDVDLAMQGTERYRYMFDKISEKAEALDDRIEYFAELLQEYYHIEDFANPSHPSQDTITAVGRVCCDAEGRLNDQSVLLETSRRLGGLHRVKLALGNVPEYTLFPGQIIGVQGANISGHYLNVTKILPPPLPPLVLREPAKLLEYNYGASKMNGRPLTFIIAAGPYTLDEDLLFNPLQDLVDRIVKEQPDLVILLGPFVDTDHPLIQLGEVDCSLEALFHTHISMRLQRLDRVCPGTTVILIPHVRDACHDYAVFPQPPLKANDLNIPKQARPLSNPCQLIVNECVIAVSSADVLFGLGSQEIARYNVVSDRLGRLSRHILQQRSFYPLFPPAFGDNLDFDHMPEIQLGATPDVLILSSHLKYFGKIVDNVVCINPGPLTKKQSGGTYARMTLHPLRLAADGTVGSEARVWERARVDIVRV